ncbi:MAG: hypothetical protein ACRDP8_02760 [Actinopolymorphaceae bacterium]
MFQDPFTRRRMLALALMSTGAVATACSGQAGEQPPSGTGAPSRRVPGEFRESPLLARQVKSGDLPPLQERLPK